MHNCLITHLIWDICLLSENLLLCLIARFFPYSCLGRPRSQWPAQAALREKSSNETHFKKVAVNLTVPCKLCIIVIILLYRIPRNNMDRRSYIKVGLQLSILPPPMRKQKERSNLSRIVRYIDTNYIPKKKNGRCDINHIRGLRGCRGRMVTRHNMFEQL